MLRYFRQSTEENAVDDVTRELHGYVSRVKAKAEVRDRFMDFEEYIWYLKKDFRKETLIDDILEFLAEHGEASESLRQELEQTQDIGLLKKYLKLAAKAGSVEEFEKIRKGLN